MPYDNENMIQNQEEGEDEEEEYENDYQGEQEEDIETHETSFSHQQCLSKYDYGTDNEDEKDCYPGAEVQHIRGGGMATVGPYQDS